jgi:hypothetical protein
LEGDAHLHFPEICHAHSSASLFDSTKLGGVTGWAQEMRVSPRGTAPYDEMKTRRLQAAAWRCKAAESQN